MMSSEATLLSMEACRLCPRGCGVNRSAGERGFCRMGTQPVVVRAALHFWEEPCLSEGGGAGTVFFAGCSLGCVYCQNREISSAEFSETGRGRVMTSAELAETFLELEAQGANNIDLVTAGHFLPAVRDALIQAREKGLSLPVVYNTGGYERPETLRMLEGLVDIYLPDLKYLDPALSEKYSGCRDYAEWAKAALAEMVRQCGDAVFDDKGHMKRGVIVRHLVLPGQTGEAKRVLRYLHETYGNRIFISLLRQYTPMPGIEKLFPELGRAVAPEEYERAVSFAERIGIEKGFLQEEGAVGEGYIPDFSGKASGFPSKCTKEENHG